MYVLCDIIIREDLFKSCVDFLVSKSYGLDIGMKFKTLVKNITKSNIFKFKKYDGILYLFFYIAIPIIVTAISLTVFPKDEMAIVYFYLTILISAFNALYDIVNRWNFDEKTMTNAKLFFMGVSVIVIVGYCLVEIIGMLISKWFPYRADWILCAYFVAVVIALWDIIACFSRDIALAEFTEDKEEY